MQEGIFTTVCYVDHIDYCILGVWSILGFTLLQTKLCFSTVRCKLASTVSLSPLEPDEELLWPLCCLFPGFVTDDPGIIFEEHRICCSSNLSQVLKSAGCQGVYVTDENKFIFHNVLVGNQSTARFKICNVNRIPCDVMFTLKSFGTKVRGRRSLWDGCLWIRCLYIGVMASSLACTKK